MGLQAAVLGASGYSGGEVLRYLKGHPVIAVAAAAGASKAGHRLGAVLPHLADVDLELVPAAELAGSDFDVVFSCIPEGPPDGVVDGARIVDLSDSHRAAAGWAYGLPELYRSELPSATQIANPGCYPTAALLCIAPFARAGVIRGPIVVDALSGTSGAGRKPADHLIHASVSSSAGAYGAVDHRHVGEMERQLARVAGSDITVSFTPHLVPMARGVLVTARGHLVDDLDDASALNILREVYASEPFVSVIEEWPATKSVTGTNRAVVSARVDPRAGMVICSAAIDNLGKGAAGQAVQNANLMFGLDETAGLEALAVWP